SHSLLLCSSLACASLDLHSFPTRRSSDLQSRFFTLGKELGQCDAKCPAYCLQSWQRGCVIPVEHICNGGMGKVCLLCQPIVRPVPFLHQFSDSFLRIHIITYLSVSILSPRKVV